MKRFIKKVFPNVIIVLSLMMLTFFVIDLINEAMAFLNNPITKVLCAVLSVVSLIFAVIFIYDEKTK